MPPRLAAMLLASKIDHFAQKDFFDSDVELIPVSEAEPVFVTVSGRTDDLSTGIFSAWRFDGLRVVALWSSDLLQQSNYEADANGFHLTYCGQEDEDHPVAMPQDDTRRLSLPGRRMEAHRDSGSALRQAGVKIIPAMCRDLRRGGEICSVPDIPWPEIPIKMLIWSFSLARERDGIT